MHIDHRMVVEAAMVALRPVTFPKLQAIYAYETLSETAWDIPNTVNEFIPNVFEDISGTLEKKVQALRVFASQMAPFPAARSPEAAEALARYRGALAGVNAAEAFSLIREIRE